jgi:hypothetical protein
MIAKDRRSLPIRANARTCSLILVVAGHHTL